MKVEVRFADEKGYVSQVGMNNLIIITDSRIKTELGLVRRIEKIVRESRPALKNRVYEVSLWGTGELWFKDRSMK